MGLLVSKGHRVSLTEIGALPEPEPMGRLHKPYHLAEVVKTLHRVTNENGFGVVGEDYALAAKDGMLFGILQLEKETGFTLGGLEAKAALGFRSSVNQITSLQLVAGGAVMVCDNMILSGNMVMVVKRHTIHMNLLEEVRKGFTKYLGHQEDLQVGVKRLQETQLSTSEAKAMVYDSILYHGMRSSCVKTVDKFYFQEMPEDCAPRSAWGLHNSFTRAFKEYPALSQFEHTISIGGMFGLGRVMQ